MAEKKAKVVESPKKAAPAKQATPAKPAVPAQSASTKPTSVGDIEAETRAAAQRIFEERQKRHLAGDEVSDWLAAEAEVKKKHKLS